MIEGIEREEDAMNQIGFHKPAGSRIDVANEMNIIPKCCVSVTTL